MGEVVNLRMARKRKAHADKEQAATENRIRHGRSKAERALDEARLSRETSFLEGHRRDGPDGNGEG